MNSRFLNFIGGENKGKQKGKGKGVKGKQCRGDEETSPLPAAVFYPPLSGSKVLEFLFLPGDDLFRAVPRGRGHPGVRLRPSARPPAGPGMPLPKPVQPKQALSSQALPPNTHT